MSLLLRTRSDNRPLTLDRVLAQGGEGAVWATDRPGLLAKIHHAPDAALCAKLDALVAAAPDDGRRALGVPAVAWPRDLVVDGSGTVRGFLMARVRSEVTLLHVAVPRLRRKTVPHLTWYGLHSIAAALARAVGAVHAGQSVVGDLRAENALVDPSGAVTLIDADSFQITVEGKLLPCAVGSEGMTPPELIDHDFATIPRRPEHDAFGLAVLIHMVLLGHHPFHGVWREAGEPPPVDDIIRRGLWPRLPQSPLAPLPDAVPFEALAPDLRTLFNRCFYGGHSRPDSRPTPAQWVAALSAAQDRLEPCLVHDHHLIDADRTACPWCALAARTGIDLFPAPPAPPGPAASAEVRQSDPVLVHRRLLRALRLGDDDAAGRLWARTPGLRSHPAIPPEAAARAAAAAHTVDRLHRLAAAIRRPATPSATLAALWDESLAAHPLAAEPAAENLTLADHGRRATARAEALAALDDALARNDGTAFTAAWATATGLFPANHWELRERRR